MPDYIFKNSMKLKKYRFLYLILYSCFIFVISFSFISCDIIDDYLVKREDYDLLNEQYLKTVDELKENNITLQEKIKENEKLDSELTEKDSQIKKMEDEISGKDIEIENLKKELEAKNIENLENQIMELEKDPQRLISMLKNINKLLKNVYIGSSTAEGSSYTFTAFSIEYKGKYYIVTAGHCVSDNYGAEGTFKFKANFSDKWITPELLDYKSEFWKLNDYAVFYGDGIQGGFKAGDSKTAENFVLGSIDKNLSIFRDLGASSKRGESGSPVINENMEVVGVYVIYGYVFTPIQLALDAINNSVIN